MLIIKSSFFLNNVTLLYLYEGDQLKLLLLLGGVNGTF